MRLNLRTISNGLFLIFLGIVLLLINYGLLGWRFFASFIDYWPVVLIVLGFGLIVNRKIPVSFAFLVLGVVMVTVNLVSPPAENNRLFTAGVTLGETGAETTKLPINYPLEENMSKADVRINGGACILKIASSDNGLVLGDVTSYGGNPKAKFDPKDSVGRLTIDTNRGSQLGRWDNCDLKFTKQIPLDFQVNAGVISGNLDFSQLKVSRFELNSGATDICLRFGANGMKTGAKISSAAAKVVLVIPKEVGLKLKYNGIPLGSVDIENGAAFSQQANTYTTDNFATAASTVDIEINGAATKVKVTGP